MKLPPRESARLCADGALSAYHGIILAESALVNEFRSLYASQASGEIRNFTKRLGDLIKRFTI